MPVFSDLLRKALRRCNRAGAPLALGVAVFGCVIVFAQTRLWTVASAVVVTEVQQVIGAEQYDAIQAQFAAVGSSPDAPREAATRLLDEVNEYVMRLPPERRETAAMDFMVRILRLAAPDAAPFLALLLLAHIGAWTYLLAIAGRGSAGVGAALSVWVRRFLVLAGSWIGMLLAAGAWLPLCVFGIGFVYGPVLLLALPSFIPVVVLLPRFLLAPAIASAEGLGIAASLRVSWERTRGAWLTVLWQMAGVGGVIWVVESLCQGFIGFLAGAVLRYSPAGALLYGIVPLLALIAAGYRFAFTVELAQDLKR